jgi:hypothetical protein
MPGARALALRARQRAEGVILHPDVMPSLAPHAQRWRLTMPAAKP